MLTFVDTGGQLKRAYKGIKIPMNNRVYLDWNATAPLHPEARDAMLAAAGAPANASSVHAEGRAARRIVEDARSTIARLSGAAAAADVIFTSGATEANMLALSPATRVGIGEGVDRLLMSAIEHPSVLAGGRFAKEQVATVPVTSEGIVDLDALRRLLAEGSPALVSIMQANNETGAIQPVREAAAIAHEAGSLLHVDAVQAFGKVPVNIEELGADLLSLSAHKIGGPAGTGALVLRAGVSIDSLLKGGGQERSRRAGTENVIGIAGFAAAAEAATASLASTAERMASLRDRFEAAVGETPGVTIFSRAVPRLPNTTLAGVAGLRAETAVIALDLDGVAVSSGSACSSGKVTASHVLAAMGVPPELARGALRFSLGWATADSEIDRAIAAWGRLAGSRERKPASGTA